MEFDQRELGTLLAALLFWREEIAAGGNRSAGPYLKSVRMDHVEPLSVPELRELSARLRRSHAP